jgi:Tfp pilus assembly ATPase PilU
VQKKAIQIVKNVDSKTEETQTLSIDEIMKEMALEKKGLLLKIMKLEK